MRKLRYLLAGSVLLVVAFAVPAGASSPGSWPDTKTGGGGDGNVLQSITVDYDGESAPLLTSSGCSGENASNDWCVIGSYGWEADTPGSGWGAILNIEDPDGNGYGFNGEAFPASDDCPTNAGTCADYGTVLTTITFHEWFEDVQNTVDAIQEDGGSGAPDGVLAELYTATDYACGTTAFPEGGSYGCPSGSGMGTTGAWTSSMDLTNLESAVNDACSWWNICSAFFDEMGVEYGHGTGDGTCANAMDIGGTTGTSMCPEQYYAELNKTVEANDGFAEFNPGYWTCQTSEPDWSSASCASSAWRGEAIGDYLDSEGNGPPFINIFDNGGAVPEANLECDIQGSTSTPCHVAGVTYAALPNWLTTGSDEPDAYFGFTIYGAVNDTGTSESVAQDVTDVASLDGGDVGFMYDTTASGYDEGLGDYSTFQSDLNAVNY